MSAQDMPSPPAAVIVPTRDRPGYLDVALASIAPQAGALGAEVIVVEDGGGAVGAIAARHGARYIGHAAARGPNAARNSGIAATDAPLIVLVDDDVEAPSGWLAELLGAASASPDFDVFGGPIRARFDGVRWPQCGREWPPVSSLMLGDSDREVDLVFAGNMLIRRRAIERAGPFAASLGLHEDDPQRLAAAAGGSAFAAGFYGDEEEWQLRHRAGGGRTLYVSAALLEHRRAGADARLRTLLRSAYSRGRVSRRWSEVKGSAPPLHAELRVLLGSLWHVLRRGCANGLLWGATAAGRLRQGLARAGAGARPGDAGEDFLAPSSGLVLGVRANATAALRDSALDAAALLGARPLRLAHAARRLPEARRVLVLGVERTDVPGLVPAARAELARSRHDVEQAFCPAGDHGKFENLNMLLEQHPLEGRDWLLVVDDDVALPRGFLDRFLFLAERFDFKLAQPAHRWRSHAAWPVTRRRGGVAHETRFVEIGPVTAFHSASFATLLPFPQLRMGWGLDAHWAALARDLGWRLGVVDAVPVRHGLRHTGSGYAHDAAVAEAREFLAGRPYLTRSEAAVTVATHRNWRSPRRSGRTRSS